MIVFMDTGGGNPPPTDPPLANMLAWYDPSDITTLFQTADTSTPVTTSGQNVRYMLDKSGNGNHLVYGAGSTMTYTESGGLKYISFTNTYLQNASFAGANALSQISMYAAWNVTAAANVIPFLIANAALTAVGLETQYQTGPVNRVYVNAATSFTFSGMANMTGSVRVVSAWFDGAAAAGLKARLRVDGVDGTGSGTSAATVTPNCTFIRLPSFATSGGGAANGLFHGMVLYSDIKAGADLDQVEDYLASKCGITI